MTPGNTGSDQAKNPQLASPSSLAGGSSSESQAQQSGVNGGGGEKELADKLGQYIVEISGLARQYPAAAPSFRQAADGIRSALRSIIANPGTPEPPAPAIGG